MIALRAQAEQMRETLEGINQRIEALEQDT